MCSILGGFGSHEGQSRKIRVTSDQESNVAELQISGSSRKQIFNREVCMSGYNRNRDISLVHNPSAHVHCDTVG